MAKQRMLNVTHIVGVDEILDNNMILEEHVTYQLLPSGGNKLEIVKWLAKRRLLHNVVECPICHVQMSLVREASITDGYRWQCRQCRKRASIRRDSFFGKSHLQLQQIIAIIYGWTSDYSQACIVNEAGLHGSSPNTIVDWCSYCRAVCQQHLIDHPVAIGGLNENFSSKIVEIDESKFFHRKYHREGHWVFGGVERGSGKCFLVEVPDRSQETLFPIIERFILPGTIVMSDGWRAYQNLHRLGNGIYEHQVIIDEQNFVHPDDASVHKQNVVNLWIRAKRKLRCQFGTSEALFASYLDEFVWRNKFRGRNYFGHFLVSIVEQYPV